MKFKVSKLDYDNGCYGCRKSCNFNGLRVSAESVKAVKKDKHGIRTMPKSAEMYGCNSVRADAAIPTMAT